MLRLTAVALSAALLASVAHADQPQSCADEPHPFICSRPEPDSGPSLNWPKKTATYRVNDTSVPDRLSPQTVIATIRASFQSWQDVDGADFQFAYGGVTPQKKIGFDFKHIDENENIVIFQANWSHDQGIIGLTTATFNAQSGEIFDADIELNSTDYDFSTNDADVRTDVQNTVTHEVGHFIGFDHTDKDGSTVDPMCATTATMSRQARPGEVTKRQIWYTDAIGMRTVYPPNKNAQYCSKSETPEPTSGNPPKIQQISYSLGGCNAAGAPWWMLLAVGLVWRPRRAWLLGLLMPTLAHAAGPQPPLCANLTNPKPFMCSHVDGDKTASLHWATGKATYRINVSSVPAHLDKDKTVAAIRASFDTWTQVDGAALTLTYNGVSTSQVVGTDYLHVDKNENLVLFEAAWPHQDRSQDRLVIALTTATFNAQSGEIYDADIELNSEFFTFTVGDVAIQTDVQNTVTHEAGHFIGFDHPDKDGSTIPNDCSSTATMSARAGNGETSKRSLAATDALGTKTVYPVGKAPQYCSPDETGKPAAFPAPVVTQSSSSLGGGCQATQAGVFWLVALVMLPRTRRFRAAPTAAPR